MNALVILRAMLLDWVRRRDGILIGLVFPVALLFLLSKVYVAGSGSTGTLVSAVAYFLPGLIAASVMVNGVFLLGTSTAELKENGMLKRIASTPLSRFDWILGNVVTQLVLGFGVALVMLLVGLLAFGEPLLLNASGVLLIVLGCFLFSGVGLLVARVAKSSDRATEVGAAISFVLILLSGTLWPVSTTPSYLQSLSSILPLTFVENGMRESLLADGAAATAFDLVVTALLAAVFFALGWLFCNWDER